MSSISRSNQFPHYPTYQKGAHSVIPDNSTKTANSLDEVLQKWNDEDIIKFRELSGPAQKDLFYSDSQQPEGLLETGRRFFANLRDPEARALHQEGINAVVKNLKKQSALPAKGILIEEGFKYRKMLGQPLSVGALKKELNQFSSQEANTCPTFSLVGKNNQKKATEIIATDLKHVISPSTKNGYTQIPEVDEKNNPPIHPQRNSKIDPEEIKNIPVHRFSNFQNSNEKN